MPIVTLRGQLGSGAPETGRLVADKLHVDYVDRDVIHRVAELLNRRDEDVAEKDMPPGSLLGRVAEAIRRSYASGMTFEDVYPPALEIPLDDSSYLAGLQSVVKELARNESIVIAGRGSQFILKDYPGAFHILMVAPLAVRVKRVMESLKVDEERAKKEIAQYDRSRRAFVRRYFHSELEDPVNYDLVLNTRHLSFEAAASIVIDALLLKDQQ